METGYASILKHLRREHINRQVRSETRQRERIVPAVSSYRWWARRTMAVTDGILAAYKKAYGEEGLIADPFVGGGTIPFAALSRGYKVYAQDINSWAAHGLDVTLRLPQADELRAAYEDLKQQCNPFLQQAYGTHLDTGEPAVISHTIRVATVKCYRCGRLRHLYPHALVSLTRRKDAGGGGAFLACPRGHLFRSDVVKKQLCPRCCERVDPADRYLAGRHSTCAQCGARSSLDELMRRSVTWKPILVQRVQRGRRELSPPSQIECNTCHDDAWEPVKTLGPIPPGSETRVLLRHGFRTWESLYPARQRAALERILQAVDELDVSRDVQATLHLAAVGVAEMAGYASRWDRWYLKNVETMALHRFNLTTLTVEPNVWGAYGYGRGTFARRVRAMMKASDWIKEKLGNELVIEGPWAATKTPRARLARGTHVRLVVGSSERIVLEDGVVDLVLTDPPYHDDIQYGELSLPLRRWAELHVHDAKGDAAMDPRNGNHAGRASYRRLLTKLFSEIHRVLNTEGRFIFTYANRELNAWVGLFQALQDAGFHAIAYEIVHAENETGPWKTGAASCDLDIILELAPTPIQQDPHRCDVASPGAEEEFLVAVGDQFLEVGRLADGWQERFRRALSTSSFLATSHTTL